MKNKKLKAILSITGYFLLVLAICISGSIVFHNTYYELVYVSGSSMYPNLNGDDEEQDGSIVDFGILDKHQSAIKNIKRFSIVSTYYFDDYDANDSLIPNSKQKIKRVIAMPNETFKIKDSKLYVLKDGEFEYIEYPFKISPDVDEYYQGKDVYEYTLKEDEYWVIGDHRDKSRDCGTFHRPIKQSYIIGVLVAIEGSAELKITDYSCSKCGSVYKNNGTCSKCGISLDPVYDLANKKYHWPKFY